MQVMSEFQDCRRQFKVLTQQRLLPPKIFMKLRYIQSSVLNQQNQQQYFNKLPEFQKQSLEQMNRQTQKAMFIGIISCFALAEKREHFKNIKAKVKKVSAFRDGVTCYLNCVGNKLNFIKIKEKNTIWKEFQLSKLKIDKIYKRIKKNKFSYCIEFQKTEFEIKFQEQGLCAKMHSLLQNLIREHSSGGNIEIIRYNLQQTQAQNQQEYIIDRIDDKDQTQELIIIQEKDHLVKLKQNVQVLLQEFQDKFKLHRNIQNGKVQINNSNNSARITIFMEKCKLKQLIECFISLQGWNTNIQNFKIIKKLRINSYLAYIKLKKTSIWTIQKEGYATISYLKDCFCYSQMGKFFPSQIQNGQNDRSSTICLSKHYICINGVEANEQGKSSNMKFNMLAEFTQMEDKNNRILISLTSNLDYSSYDLFAKKFEVNLEMLKDLPFLNVYYKERTIQNNSLQLFQINRCICTINPRQQQIIKQDEERSISSRKGSATIQNLQFQQIASNKLNYLTNSEIIQVIKDQLKEIKNEKIIQIIKKRLYESYYLKHRFQLTQKDQQYKKSDYKLNIDTDFLLQNSRWKITRDESYVFANQQQLNIQKGVLKLVIKQITSNILAGKSIMTMSLPVEIFDKKSLLAGAADLLGFLPYYLNKAVNTDSVIEQIKYICGAFMFMYACQPKINKPFNPIIGQTLQVFLGGIPLFIEQTSHHPPISSIYMKTNQFECHGSFQMHIDMGLNAAYSKSYGFYYVKIFATNTNYIIKLPDLEFCGVMFGERSLKVVGKAFVFETSTDTYLEYSIGKSRKKMYQYSYKLKDADIGGGIFKVTKNYSVILKNLDRKKSVEGAKPEDILEKYSQISGKWYGDLFFDNVEYKSLKNGPFPIIPERPEILLPSDSLFREDVIYKVWGDNKTSNEQKQILQNLQRKDRQLREKHRK